jgi:hypothetical protein
LLSFCCGISAESTPESFSKARRNTWLVLTGASAACRRGFLSAVALSHFTRDIRHGFKMDGKTPMTYFALNLGFTAFALLFGILRSTEALAKGCLAIVGSAGCNHRGV